MLVSSAGRPELASPRGSSAQPVSKPLWFARGGVEPDQTEGFTPDRLMSRLMNPRLAAGRSTTRKVTSSHEAVLQSGPFRKNADGCGSGCRRFLLPRECRETIALAHTDLDDSSGIRMNRA